MMTRKMKRGGACILALAAVLAVLSPGPGRVYGADAIEKPKDGCSITFSLADSVIPEGAGGEEIGFEDYYNGLAGEAPEGGFQTAINVELYQVADVSAGGIYTVTDAFREKDSGNTLDFSDISAQTLATEWLTKAEAAAKLVEAENSGLRPARTLNILEKKKEEGLDTGLYLVYVKKDTVKTAEYVYNFTPFLVSLPGNNYYNDVAGGAANPSDAWQYDVTVGLKPGREPLLGSLEIRKTLDGYHERLGKAVFVFDVTAVKGNETVYSNVVSLEFGGGETEKIRRVDGIPAGSVVTVKEVYTGSSYEQTSSDPQSVTVIPAGENQQSSGTVSFTNRYDGRINGGAGVENHFEYVEETNGGRWDFTPGPAGRQASGGEGQ